MRTLSSLAVVAILLVSCAQPDPVPSPQTTGTTTATTHDGDMADGTMDEHDDDHTDAETLEWDGEGVPEISVEVTGDNTRGWTVTTSLANFRLSDMSETEHVPGAGHAHIWLDGQVFTMMSQETTVIPHLDPGTHEVMVTLSSNTHLDYVFEGERLMARTTVEVEGEVADHPVIVVTIADGEVIVDSEPEVAIGDEVELRITSDTSDSVHVHGYDVLGSLEPGVETIVRFTADIPGIFEVELESTGLHVFDLAVR